MFKIFIKYPDGKISDRSTTADPQKALAIWDELKQRRTDTHACAYLCDGNEIRKSYQIDADFRGRRTRIDVQIADEATIGKVGRPQSEEEKPIIFNLRLPPALHTRLSASAREGGISLHQHILNALEGNK